jgi:hypothetical protein
VLSGATALAFVSAATAGVAAATGAGAATFADGDGPSLSLAEIDAQADIAADPADPTLQRHAVQVSVLADSTQRLADLRKADAARAARDQQRQALTSANPKIVARAMLGRFGWGVSQFSCLDSLWTRESKWSLTATNPTSGAYGIPQALPGSKMASVGSDWRTSALTQITWGLGYIRARYGSPCGAWAHSEASGWY